MNRRIAGIAAAGAIVLGIGAVGVNAATAHTSGMQPVKSAVPPVVSSTGTTSGMANSTMNNAATVKAATHHTSTTAGGRRTGMRASKSASATRRAMQKASGVRVKAHANRVGNRARLHIRNNVPLRSGSRVNGG